MQEVSYAANEETKKTMSAKRRRGKKTDQTETEKAYQLLIKTMQDHPEIEKTLWAGACWTALVNGYLNSGIPVKEFIEDFDSAKEHYIKWFEENST